MISSETKVFTFQRLVLPCTLALMCAGICYCFDDDSAEHQLQSYPLEIHGSVIRSLDFSPDNHVVAVGIHGSYKDEKGTNFSAGIAVVNIESRQLIAQTFFDSGASTHDYWSYAPKFLHYMPDGRRLLVYEKGVLRVFDAASLRRLQ